MSSEAQQRIRFNNHGRGRWRSTEIDRAPAVGGTYAIFVDQELQYIGSAANVRARLQDHGIGKKWGPRFCSFGAVDAVTLKVAADLKFGRWLMREARLIRRLKPPRNKTTWRTQK